MPLGLFGGNSSKSHILNDGSQSARDRKDGKNSSENSFKGQTLKLTNSQVTIEKKLAEGGFAIVYLVTDRKNRKFALKRQFVFDNQKQLEACIRECKIVNELRGHKNIVEYVDHMVSMNKNGQYDCMLMTVYHKRNVLQLMNDRISNNMFLSPNEILNIFCDMCEAVARLHHSQTPVIHRDLKVENILIDERNRAAPPIFVLCDFGSATTKVLSINSHSASVIQEEIERNTTLCYRAPEMIDIYGGQPIGTKSDMWSLGVMLYRLSYFALPFDESALAIQNGIYSAFPAAPELPAAIRAIIYLLLDVDVNRRLAIYECASLAFEAYGKTNPIENVYNVPKMTLEQAIIELKEGKPRNQRDATTTTPPPAQQASEPPHADAELIKTTDAPPMRFVEPTTTSVNPRLRPKATQIVPTVPNLKIASKPEPSRHSYQNETHLDANESPDGPLSCPLMKPQDLGFTDLNHPCDMRNRAATDSKASFADQQQQHRRNVSDTSQIAKSAFKPYSQTAAAKTSVRSVEDVTQEWNPFLAAPFTAVASGMDDRHFGKVFDELPRKDALTDDDDDDDADSIDSRDPFGAAPFDTIPEVSSARQAMAAAAAAAGISPRPPPRRETPMLLRSVLTRDRAPPVPTHGKDDDSEVDEQRMRARRRYSYENIDGVGDDASSDSRGRTDRDSEDDETDSWHGGDTSHDEDDGGGSSQNTVGSEDGEGGSRPLLEDDGLEDDDDHELLASFHEKMPRMVEAPLFVGTNTTNPFLRDELTPKLETPPNVQASNVWSTPDENPLDRWSDRRDTVFEKPTFEPTRLAAFAPATLPRQVKPLSAVAKPKPEIPSTAPVSIIPSMSTTSFPDAVANHDDGTRGEPAVGTLILVGAPTTTMETKPKSMSPVAFAGKTMGFVEGPKTPKPAKSKKVIKEKHVILSDHTDPETDGSEAEICADKAGVLSGKKKKKSAFGIRSSHPSILPNDLQFATPIAPKKSTKDKKSSSAVKRASTGALNASFVNSSFQCEDADYPSSNHHF
ncbi:unnamed protein product [Caenorhabditis bovis]|uniref:non-specific serine/threonine protein kinase n=1 Tax=Caenorhabditis bovis TaxID=2654633 RepID=A0A8S1EDJ7_9PELO|nr:unnamed protein product [Caenorhabditis bovis]